MNGFHLMIDYLPGTSLLFVTDMNDDHAKVTQRGAKIRPTREYKKISTPGDAATAVKDAIMELEGKDDHADR